MVEHVLSMDLAICAHVRTDSVELIAKLLRVHQRLVKTVVHVQSRELDMCVHVQMVTQAQTVSSTLVHQLHVRMEGPVQLVALRMNVHALMDTLALTVKPSLVSDTPVLTMELPVIMQLSKPVNATVPKGLPVISVNILYPVFAFPITPVAQMVHVLK